MERQPMVVIS